MAIKYIRADTTYAARIRDVGQKAFGDDGWQNTIFPKRLQDPNDPDAVPRFMLKRLEVRLANEGVHTIVAIDEDERDENGEARVLGYCSWHEPGKGDNEGGDRVASGDGGVGEDRSSGWVDDGQGGKRGDGEKYPKIMDVEAWWRVDDLLQGTKKEIFGEQQSNLWYLGSLGVDPACAGRRIGSQFAEWGLERAQNDGVPAYLESTLAARNMYARAGFQFIKEMHSPDDGGRPHTAMVWRPSQQKK